MRLPSDSDQGRTCFELLQDILNPHKIDIIEWETLTAKLITVHRYFRKCAKLLGCTESP